MSGPNLPPTGRAYSPSYVSIEEFRERHRIDETPGVHGRRLRYVLADDIEPAIDQPGLVDGLLERTGMTVVYGESTAGKSFVVTDLARTIASPFETWNDLDVGQGAVVYVAAEAPRGIERRVWAWKHYHGVASLPLAVVRSQVDLLIGDATAIVDLVNDLRDQLGEIGLVVIDTLAQAMLGNENAPDDMGRFVSACSCIRAETGAHVLIVHHTGKETAKGARGHSSLRAATDVEIEVLRSAEGGARTMRVSKNREGEEGQAYGFALQPVELGANAKGRAITTCVAVPAEAPAAAEKQRKLGPNERIALDALRAAIFDQGEPAPAAADVPLNVRGVPVARWEEAAMRYLPQGAPKRKREAFNRAVPSLVAAGHVRQADGFAWLK